MKLIKMLAIASASSVFAANAWAADYNVTRSLQLAHPMADIWRSVGGFCDVDDWHPSVIECEENVIEGKLHRVLTMKGGGTVIEQRIAKERGLSYSYKASQTPLPVSNFVATLSIVAGDTPTITWSASFSSDDPDGETKVIAMIESGLSGMKTTLGEN